MNLPNFKKVLRGLDPEEVHEFWTDMYKQLAEIGIANKDLTQQNASLHLQNKNLFEKLEYYKDLEGQLRDAILASKQVAAQLEKDAQVKANSLVTDAESKVASLHSESSTIVQEAQEKAEAIVADAQSEADNLLAKVNRSITTKLSEADTKVAEAENHLSSLTSHIEELESVYTKLKTKKDKLDNQIVTATEYLLVIKRDVFTDLD